MVEAKELTDIVEPIIRSELPDSEKVTEIVRSISIRREEYSGPLPQPAMLKGFEEIVPGAADRILSMAEREQAHRHAFLEEKLKQDGKELEGLLRANKISQRQAFVLVLALIGAGCFLTYLDHTAVGMTIFGTTIISVASIFIVGFVKNKNKFPKNGK